MKSSLLYLLYSILPYYHSVVTCKMEHVIRSLAARHVILPQAGKRMTILMSSFYPNNARKLWINNMYLMREGKRRHGVS